MATFGKTKRRLFIAYCLLWAMVAANSILAANAGDNEMLLSAGFFALALSMPFSFLMPGSVQPVLMSLGLSPPYCGVICDFFVFQIICFIAGTVQWFVVLPRIAKLFRR